MEGRSCNKCPQVCNTKGDFVFVLVGWEGSAVDSCFLRDVISRPNGLKVPKGITTYLTRGTPNMEGFLAPYGAKRYHLQEWRGAGNSPTTAKEFLNMKHSSTQNVIERYFGLLKDRWAILRKKFYYPVQVQCRTILACCPLHNVINREMTNIDILEDINEGDSTYATTAGDDIHYNETSCNAPS
ncbi:putative nuclease HARBI1 [Cucumis melo var. makuwa]|uniref:Nuclease HARBI1 n=1 Tax=Cucumis melo var. makuwa TaxID=1194695 RepID=A0A5A7SXN8_CUCMM|nr:putative nuclease HARBI1 [Cucumis melo var. makuwa]